MSRFGPMSRFVAVAALIASAPFASLAQEEFPTASPESQGVSPEALQGLTAEMHGYFEDGLVVAASWS